MDSTQAQRFRFVHNSNPTRPGEEEKRLIRSHASREAYAKIRRIRVANYLSLSKTTTNPNHNEHKTALPSLATAESGSTVAMNPPSLLSAGQVDPFGAFAVPLRPMESFLLDHYVRVVIPASTDTCQSFRESGWGAFFKHRMTVDWVPLALADPGLLSGVLLAACRHLAVVEQDNARRYVFKTMAIQYKLVCLRNLTAALAVESLALGDSAMAKVIALGIDEITLGNIEVSRSHLLGAMKMADLRGGPENLGLNGLLTFILRRLMNDKGILQNYDCFGKSYDGLEVVR
ncbi:hypothetical protein B0T25DRAFT_170962 [Lasiosphaeria hispida]|uniref:Uncharacterized protein n=1 Tax=Lasiosphaeria hispida TaxID=260671 RepID=A0AAJ0HMY2_9PEZI|nr:hypothetical protein B0T25DRAFT_170962 [Lasiosphaeria hispida]